MLASSRDEKERREKERVWKARKLGRFGYISTNYEQRMQTIRVKFRRIFHSQRPSPYSQSVPHSVSVSLAPVIPGLSFSWCIEHYTRICIVCRAVPAPIFMRVWYSCASARECRIRDARVHSPAFPCKYPRSTRKLKVAGSYCPRCLNCPIYYYETSETNSCFINLFVPSLLPLCSI